MVEGDLTWLSMGFIFHKLMKLRPRWLNERHMARYLLYRMGSQWDTTSLTKELMLVGLCYDIQLFCIARSSLGAARFTWSWRASQWDCASFYSCTWLLDGNVWHRTSSFWFLMKMLACLCTSQIICRWTSIEFLHQKSSPHPCTWRCLFGFINNTSVKTTNKIRWV